MMKKKITALVTVAAMIFSMIPMSSIAVETAKVDDTGYTNITSEINPQVIGTYCNTAGDISALFDGDPTVGSTFNRKARLRI